MAAKHRNRAQNRKQRKVTPGAVARTPTLRRRVKLPRWLSAVLRGTWNCAIITLVTLWPLVLSTIDGNPGNIATVRVNDVYLGMSAWLPWLASVLAAWNLLVLRDRTDPNPSLFSLVLLVLGLLMGGLGLNAIINDDVRQAAINRQWGNYQYTMPVAFESDTASGAAFNTPHANIPVVYFHIVSFSLYRGKPMCADVHRGWLGGMWIDAPHDCKDERAGQRMATPADLMQAAAR